MHPIVAEELVREMQRSLDRRVGSPRRPRPSSRKRWHWRSR